MPGAPPNDTENRFWRWQTFHTDQGAATTINPNEQFNAVIKKVAQLLECSSHLIKSPGILSRLKKKSDLKHVEFKTTFSRLQQL
ncbi:hypothetical protein H310_12705 [Aphanomyces invadans]|uniref:Uncharacterized protein n=1 Tax=Aphanomyces invadans TaxID=157072 RepID=A0A024TGJ0_9STRA|nr:hypothetical protein H310_12705 [Aphanomyces invadans]ETV93275.1 hypothetical protein H310_12705 [Aphanomyces invadans]|eukprot:XP_008878110.1 hypothetical protein H310_12705 [Aphanomyces invadans]